MVFYFSGTGNSALVARQIAEGLGDEMVSINQCLKEKETKNFRAKEPLIFVAPTYAWQMPKVVHRWIQESSFSRQAEGLFRPHLRGKHRQCRRLCKKTLPGKEFAFSAD